jgi:hypothetical protein
MTDRIRAQIKRAEGIAASGEPELVGRPNRYATPEMAAGALAGALLVVLDMHAFRWYDKWGRETEDREMAESGWCNECGNFKGLACPERKAIANSLGVDVGEDENHG